MDPAAEFATLQTAVPTASCAICLVNDSRRDDTATTSPEPLPLPPTRSSSLRTNKLAHFIKSGSTSAVFGLSQLAVKFNIASSTSSVMTAARTTLQSASCHEADATAIGYALSARLSAHVVQPFGLLPFTIEMPAFTTVRGCCVDGFITERIEGVRLNDDICRVRDLAEFIRAGLDGKLVFNKQDAFPDALRALIFQVRGLCAHMEHCVLFSLMHVCARA